RNFLLGHLKSLEDLASFCQNAHGRSFIRSGFVSGFKKNTRVSRACIIGSDTPNRRREWRISAATARVVHSGQARPIDETCPRGSLRIYLAPLASRTEIPSPRPASHQGWSVAKCGWPVPLSCRALL